MVSPQNDSIHIRSVWSCQDSRTRYGRGSWRQRWQERLDPSGRLPRAAVHLLQIQFVLLVQSGCLAAKLTELREHRVRDQTDEVDVVCRARYAVCMDDREATDAMQFERFVK